MVQSTWDGLTLAPSRLTKMHLAESPNIFPLNSTNCGIVQDDSYAVPFSFDPHIVILLVMIS
jgi:hypothetical protein